jgi:hypothetical protein
VPSVEDRVPAGGLVAYEWCVLRVVPRVERCEFVNAGAVVYSRAGDVLVAGVELDAGRALALDPGLDVAAVRRHLDVVTAVCSGVHPATAELAPGARFRWLTAARSTVVQASPVHTGISLDPAGELDRLLDAMVRPVSH